MPSFGIDLHDAHHAQDRIRGLERVRVERDGEIVVGAPAGAEVENVAGLEAGVVGAPPVGELEAPFPLRLQRGETRLFGRGDLRIIRVAENKDMELPREPGRDDPLHHRLDIADDPLGILVAHAPQDRGPGRDRLVAGDARRDRRDGRDRIGRAHDEQSESRVPEADHRPGQRDGEQQHQDEVDDRKAAGRKREGQEPDQPHHRGEDDQGEEHAARGQGVGRPRGGDVQGAFGHWMLFEPKRDIASGGFRVQSE